jgi:hypothetical protein
LAFGDILLVRFWCVDTEQASVNSVWYHVDTVGFVPATDQDVADTFNTSYAPLFLGILNANAEFRGVEAQMRNNVAPYSALGAVVFNNSLAGPGVAGPNALPRQTCGLGSFQTMFAGPGQRGRIYYPFPCTADDDTTGKPTAGYQTRIGTITNDLTLPATIAVGGRSATLGRILVHRKNKAGVIPPISTIVGGTFAVRWATQRRRGSFGRPNTSPI